MTKRTTQEERQQDEELVAFTDALLQGEPAEDSRRPELADAVEGLARALAPHAPPARLRQAIRRSVAAEWTRRQPSVGERMQRLLKTAGAPRYRWAWAAATSLVVLILATTLLFPTGIQEVTGTATGEASLIALVATIAVMLILVLVLIWINARRR